MASATGQRSDTLTVFGWMCVGLGTVGLLAMFTSFFFGTLARLLGQAPPETLVSPAWQAASMVLSVTTGVVLLTAGIGLVRRQSWGRPLVGTYVIFILLSIVHSVIELALWSPKVIAEIDSELPGMGMALMVVCGSLFALVYAFALAFPLSLWYIVTRPRVTARFDDFRRRRPQAAQVYAQRYDADRGLYPLVPYDNPYALCSLFLAQYGLYPVFGLLPAIGALVMARRGLREVEADPLIGGRPHAWVALVVSVLALAGHVLAPVGFVLLIVLAAAAAAG